MHVLITSFDYDDTIVLRVMLADTFNRHVQPLLDADVSNDDRAAHEELIAQTVMDNTTHSIYAQSWDENASSAGLSGYNITKIIHIPVMDC